MNDMISFKEVLRLVEKLPSVDKVRLIERIAHYVNNDLQNSIKKIDMDPEDARALLAINHQLRIHYNGAITQHLVLVVTINIVLWSYFFKTYSDSISGQLPLQPLFFGTIAAISSISIGLSRLYTHLIDDNITRFYPRLLILENTLSIPPRLGILGQLIEDVPSLESIIKKLEPEQQIACISRLVENKRIGYRGHRGIDVLSMLIISCFIIIPSNVLGIKSQSILNIYPLIVIIIGFGFVLIGFMRGQKDPPQKDFQKSMELYQYRTSEICAKENKGISHQ